ncbi:hypothetical protein L204_103320 [Cryptococcus depauperatus]|nr:hypothetical protein L204_01637 [Cryptococcus depauperatus CBS 7855]
MFSKHYISLISERRLILSPAHIRAIQTTRSAKSPTPAPVSSSPKATRNSLVQRYAPALDRLSQRSGVPLHSIALSVLILHEITAFLPLIGFYYLFASMGAGAGLVAWISELGSQQTTKQKSEESQAEWKLWVKDWYDEGTKRVDRMGKKYGILGYEKQETYEHGSSGNTAETLMVKSSSVNAAEKVANAIAAYVLVKALLPLRIGISIAGAPVFARYTLMPLQRLFRRNN